MRFTFLTLGGDWEGQTVPVVVLTLDSVVAGRTEFTYMDKTENAFQTILQDKESWSNFFDHLAQLDNNGSQDIALNEQNSDLLGEVNLMTPFSSSGRLSILIAEHLKR